MPRRHWLARGERKWHRGAAASATMAGTMRAATDSARSALLRQALALSMGAAISLGITRFAYGLLLPPMRDDLGWSFTLAGSMNTANALSYLLRAL